MEVLRKLYFFLHYQYFENTNVIHKKYADLCKDTVSKSYDYIS